MRFLIILLLTMLVLQSCKTRQVAPEITKIQTPSMCSPRGLAIQALAEIEGVLPLFEGLGDYTIPITTRSKKAQQYFDQGFKLTVGFNHAEAVRSFRYAIMQDEECAMCYWGLAYALGPNYNAGMEPETVTVAYQAAQNAKKLSDKVTPKEKLLIEAMAVRYPMAPVDDRSSYDQAYADRLRKAYQEFPEDDHIGALFAESLMDMHPWQIWKKNGEMQPWTAEIMNTIESILARNPEHVASVHLYIHATEASQDPGKAKPYADKLPELTPGAGHLVHMPAHTYIRTGDYHSGVIVNEEAVQVDSTYFTACHAAGIYPLAYFPHNYHFLAACAALAGERDIAVLAAYRMVNQIDTNLMRAPGLEAMQHFWIIPYYMHVKFSEWDRILALPQPAADLLYPNAIWHYARGMAFAGKGQLASAKTELKGLRKYQDHPALAELTIWDINSVADLIDIADKVLEGEIAAKEKNYDLAVRLLTEAIAIEDGLNYNEPPDWFFSVRHHLGPVLMDKGSYAEAEALYKRDLELFPETGWALHGLYQSLMKQGKKSEAKPIKDRFEKAWEYADTKLEGSRVAS